MTGSCRTVVYEDILFAVAVITQSRDGPKGITNRP